MCDGINHVSDEEPARLRQKKVDTLRAELALAGPYVLHELSDGAFVINHWGLTRRCADLDAVEAFLVSVGGTP